MLKRTRGHILLILLVLTGFAGKVSNQTISSTERRLLVNQLKETKTALLQSIDGLSEKQLAFRLTTGSRSIAEQVLWLEAVQQHCLQAVETAISKRTAPCLAFSPAQSNPAVTAEQLLSRTKITESFLVKYAKTTTEDLHACQVQTPDGPIEGYQALLKLPALTQDCIAHIESLKKDHRFPR